MLKKDDDENNNNEENKEKPIEEEKPSDVELEIKTDDKKMVSDGNF